MWVFSLVLPLSADRALGVLQIAVKGEVFRPTGLADAFASDKGRGWLRVACDDEYGGGWFVGVFDVRVHVV